MRQKKERRSRKNQGQLIKIRKGYLFVIGLCMVAFGVMFLMNLLTYLGLGDYGTGVDRGTVVFFGGFTAVSLVVWIYFSFFKITIKEDTIICGRLWKRKYTAESVTKVKESSDGSFVVYVKRKSVFMVPDLYIAAGTEYFREWMKKYNVPVESKEESEKTKHKKKTYDGIWILKKKKQELIRPYIYLLLIAALTVAFIRECTVDWLRGEFVFSNNYFYFIVLILIGWICFLSEVLWKIVITDDEFSCKKFIGLGKTYKFRELTKVIVWTSTGVTEGSTPFRIEAYKGKKEVLYIADNVSHAEVLLKHMEFYALDIEYR